MSLKGVHLVFIAAATLLALVFALWCLDGYRSGGGTGLLVAGVASLLSVGGLVAYGGWFVRKMGRIR